MRRIRIQNPLLDKTFQAFLSADYSSGTSLSVYSNVSFSADDILVIGEPKEELTESKKMDSKTGLETITLASALNFDHPKDTSIYKTLWDYVSLEGRSSSAGNFAEITQSGLQWDNKDGETIYYHSDGDDNWQYRFRFYNSVTATYSEYSPTLGGAGFTRKQVGYMIRQVRKITNVYDQKVVSDDELIRQFNMGQDIVYAHNPRYWFLLVDSYKQNDPIAAVADTSVYSLADYDNFGHLDSMRYHYESGGEDILYPLEKKPPVEFDRLASDLTDSTNDYAEIFKLLPADSSSDNGYIQVYPKTKTSGVGEFYPNYFEKMADLDSVDDETQIPLPYILEEFAIAFVYRIKGDDAKAKTYESGLISDNEDRVPRHLLLLDKLDRAQQSVQRQARSMWRYKGQRAMKRLFGSPRYSRDWIKKNYIDDL